MTAPYEKEGELKKASSVGKVLEGAEQNRF